MKMRILLVISVFVFTMGALQADTFGTGANQFTIDFVTISANTNPGGGYGKVKENWGQLPFFILPQYAL
jgi:hypothetical protein